MNVRPATVQDEQVLHQLSDEFEAEIPEPAGWTDGPWEAQWTALQSAIAAGAMFIAEDGDGAAGMLEAVVAEPGRWHVETVFVRERARRTGVAKALLHACAAAARAAGATHISLGVLVTNTVAETVWRRLGFEPVELVLAQPLDSLDGRLGNAQAGPSRGSIHAKTDDRISVDRAVEEVVPRLSSPAVTQEPGGWIRISDDLLDADREIQMALASDISDRLGAAVVALALEHGEVVRFRLYERGLMLDEYLSVPTYYEALDLGDALALHANPTLVARFTGAERDEVRRVAKTGDSPADLPPAETLYADIAKLMGLTP
jgi:ribosomal protein S18 acetylase RimI-like enzyme